MSEPTLYTRIIEGDFDTLLQGPKTGESRDDYLLVRLSDRKAIFDPMGRLREIYPNVLHLERPGLLQSGELRDSGRRHLRQSERRLFASFFEQMTGEGLTEEQARLFADVVDSLRQDEREVQSCGH